MDRPAFVDLFYESLPVVQAEDFLARAVSVRSDGFVVRGEFFPWPKRIRVLAFGKASVPMARALIELLDARRISDGLCITHFPKEMTVGLPPQVRVQASSHPFLSTLSLDAGRAALEFASGSEPGDFVFSLVSGGGSAMMAAPAEQVEFGEKRDYLNGLLLKGVGEREVNVVRKALSAIKGGKLALALSPARILNLVLSDEREHRLSAIASGPTVPNDDAETAIEILRRYGHFESAPHWVKQAVSRALDGQVRDFGARVKSHVIATRDDLILEIARRGQKIYSTIGVLRPVDPRPFQEALRELIDQVMEKANAAPEGRHLLIGCGEIPVVPVPGSRGGRNQHLVLCALRSLSQLADLKVAAIATDGCDFLAGVHGAWGDADLLTRAAQAGWDTGKSIQDTESYLFHEKFGTLLTGTYTGTNVSDVYLIEFRK